MIKVIVGDLLSAKESIIVHQANCQKKMGSGIALQIKEKYPSSYEEYMKHTPKLGNVLFTMEKNEFECKYIAHLYAQKFYGYDGKRYTNYEAFYQGLEHIKKRAKQTKLSVALPWRIGSDRGGADWNVIYAMIDSIFEDYEVTIYKLEE